MKRSERKKKVYQKYPTAQSAILGEETSHMEVLHHLKALAVKTGTDSHHLNNNNSTHPHPNSERNSHPTCEWHTFHKVYMFRLICSVLYWLILAH
jgi:hypothetical protein